MTISAEQRLSDSPFIESVTCGRTLSDGAPIRPAETNWHMVFVRHRGSAFHFLVGPWTRSSMVTYGADAEILWIRFKLGVFMPHLPTRDFLDSETLIPQAAARGSFWLKSAARQFPDFENAETFVKQLAREEVLVIDPVVTAALQGHPLDISPRTLRHRFLRATGLSQNHIFQHQRAQQAAALLQQGTPILDTVFEAGYFDQPHLTRSLKQFIGFTPGQLVRPKP